MKFALIIVTQLFLLGCDGANRTSSKLSEYESPPDLRGEWVSECTTDALGRTWTQEEYTFRSDTFDRQVRDYEDENCSVEIDYSFQVSVDEALEEIDGEEQLGKGFKSALYTYVGSDTTDFGTKVFKYEAFRKTSEFIFYNFEIEWEIRLLIAGDTMFLVDERWNIEGYIEEIRIPYYKRK